MKSKLCMRNKFFSIGMIIFLMLFIIACGGGGGGSATTPAPLSSAKLVTITGNFSGGQNALLRLLDKILPSKALALNSSDVAKVIVIGPAKSNFSGIDWGNSYKYKINNVNSNRTFTVDVERDVPVGMIFVDYANQYLGYLSLKNGITAIPTNLISATSFTIDLGTLSSSGFIVKPSRDPLTSEITMTAAELKSLAQICSMFSSIVKNPDVDGNGVIDFLEGKSYFMQIIYVFDAGSFDSNLVAAVHDFKLNSNQLTFSPPLSYQPDSATIIGPVGSPFESPTTLGKALGDPSTNRYYYFVSLQKLLTEGTYTVKGSSGGNLTYYIPDQSSMMSDAIVIIPAVTLNQDRTIKKISWTYKMVDGSEPVDPRSFISVIGINMSSKVPVYNCGSNPNCDPYGYPTIFTNPPAQEQEIDLSSKKISSDTLSTFSINYTDIYQNVYTFNYSH